MSKSNPSPNLSIVVKGRVLHGRESKEYAEKHGLCNICGLYQTHKKVGSFMKSRMEPITVTNSSGVTTVYKGYCIQPTCYTSVDQVREILGETPISSKRRPSTSHRYPIKTLSLEHVSVGRASKPHSPLPQVELQSAYPSARISPKKTKKKLFRPPGMLQPPVSVPELEVSPVLTAAIQHNPMHLEQLAYRPHDQQQADASVRSEISFHPEGSYNPKSPQDLITGGPGSAHRQLQPGDEVWDANNSGSYNNFCPDSANPKFSADSTETGALTVGSSLPKDDSDVSAQIHPVVAELQDMVSDGGYIEFLNTLDSHGTETHVILEGFRLFRFYLSKDQLAKPSSVILGGDSWVKTLNSKVDKAIGDGEVNVVVGGLLTFLTISVLPGNYKRSMVKKGAVDLVSKALNKFPDDNQVTDLSCATLVSLSMSEKDGLNARYEKVASVIRKLADIVRSSGHCGRELALRALYHLSNQRKRSNATNKAPSHDVRNALLTGDALPGAIVDIIRAKDVRPSTVEAGMSLLWKLSVPRDDNDEELIPITEDLVQTVVLNMQRFNSEVVIEAGGGIFANFVLRENVSSDEVQLAAGTICHFLSNKEIVDEVLAISCCHTFCNFLSNLSLRGLVVSNSPVMKTVLDLMRQYPESELVVEYGCLAIAQACYDDQKTKEFVVNNGGFDIINRAFRDFVTSRTDAASMEVKDASLCSIASLSGCHVGAQQVMQSGLLDIIEATHAVEVDTDFRMVLSTILTNTRRISANGFASGSEGILRQQPALFSQLLQNAGSEEKVASLLQDLRKMGQSSLLALGGQGFDTLLSTLSNFRNSKVIQEHGCAILAEAYYHLQPSALDAPVQLPNGSWVIIHTEMAIETIHDAMLGHRGHAGIQNYACCGLSNFLIPIGEQNPSLLFSWMDHLLNDVLDAMHMNRADENVQKSGIVLFWTLLIFCGEDCRKRWSLRFLQPVFDSMIQFPTNVELQMVACDVLMALQEDQASLEAMGSTTGVTALLVALETDKTGVAGRASAILSSVLKTVYIASSKLIQVPDAIRKLIFCLTSNESEPQIQINICSALESLINFEDYSVRVTIAGSGGLLALCKALNVHGSDVVLTEQACRVLSFVIPLAEQNSFVSMRTFLGNTLVWVLENHIEDPDVEAAVIDALWTCCSQDDYFKHILVNERSLNAIVQAMTLQLGSSELVRSGSSLLWILSGYGHGKQMIGDCGGISVIVNGVLAHNQSTAVLKEGLTALKNLATFPGNSLMIEQADSERLVMYALWIHYRDPQVISISLSALNNIAVDSATRTVSMMKEEILEIVIAVMQRFPTDEQVQKNACFYLKSCSYLDANLRMMSRYSAKLIPLLQKGADTFPRHCKDRAGSTIRKIQQCQH